MEQSEESHQSTNEGLRESSVLHWEQLIAVDSNFLKKAESAAHFLERMKESGMEPIDDEEVLESIAGLAGEQTNPTSQLSREELLEDLKTLGMLQKQAQNQSAHVGGLKSTSKLHHPTILRKNGKAGKRLKISGGSNGDLSMMKSESFESEVPDIDFIKIWKISSFFMPASLKKKVFAPAFEDLKQDLLLSEEYRDSNPKILKCAFMTKTAWMYLDCIYTAISSKAGQTALSMLPYGLKKFWRNQQ